MKLPIPDQGYNRAQEMRRNDTLEQADAANRKRGQDVEIGASRLILTSPDGTRWSVTVDNAGTLAATSL